MPEIVNKQIVGLSFGFLHDEEIKKLSVKQITNSYTFDNLRNPVANGFYDGAFGPLNFNERCATCSNTEKDCPGHSGHLKLAVPIYNVFLFDLLFKFLDLKCWNCHHLKTSVLRKKSTLAQLIYIESGHVLKARDVEELGIGTGLKELPRAELEKVLDKHIEKAEKLLKKTDMTNHKLTFHVAAIRGKLIRSFISGSKSAKCSHCQAMSPTFRRDGSSKIFINALSSAAEQYNARMDVHIVSVMNGMQHGKDMSDEKSNVGKTDPATAAKGSKKGSKKAKQASNTGSDSERSDDEEVDMELSDDENLDEVLEDLNTQKAHGKLAVKDIEETKSRLMLPNEVERHLQLLWNEEHDLLSRFFAPDAKNTVASAPYNGADYRAFFHRVLLVPPSRYRQPSVLGGEIFENDLNVQYRKIFDLNETIVRAVRGQPVNAGKNVSTAAANGTAGEVEVKIDILSTSNRNQVVQAWMQMQQVLNTLFDSDKTGSALQKNSGAKGLRQILEKKEGLFRKNMMGKRVNFAARSVISPDPYLHTREIGIPDIFAKTLTYPQPVTPWNVEQLRKAVINGPDVHPGANAIIEGRGKIVSLEKLDKQQRIALAKTLLSETSTEGESTSGGYPCSVEKNPRSTNVGDGGPKVVLRHLITGDTLLVNRQPTLHKPSMMAHVARVLYGENVIRMHYANCNTYNADFDGDEINLHFPQNELARAEAYDIANNDNQYIVPTSANPLRGLIQDHVICGVRLTQRNTFLNLEMFQQFLYLGIADSDLGYNAPIKTPIPTIMKPRQLWTGKQIMTSVLDVVTAGKPGFNLNPTKTKVPANQWGKAGEEDGYVVIRDNVLVQGVLDKAQFGASKYGMVHAVYELYGATAAGNLLTVLARLFTRVLQYDGFTCTLEDMLLLSSAEIKRRELIQGTHLQGYTVAAETAGLKGMEKDDLLNTNAVSLALQRFFRDNKDAGVVLDGAVKGVMNKTTSDIISACLPNGQRIPFPHNNMALMTLSGAKGSMVNFSQISCLLGQQELEGRRVPVTQAGKTLPSFPKYDPQPRAGGYITQRFFTGIRPQEYYFHSMAGREGLVDTAVKTANSGYLQRCIIKQLESLSVQYDYSVRDCDGSIVQFMYGEDSVDIIKSSYLNNMTFLAENYAALVGKLNPSSAIELLDIESVEDYLSLKREEMKDIEDMKEQNKVETEKEQRKMAEKMDKDGQIREKDRKKYTDRARQRAMEISRLEKDLFVKYEPVLSKFPPGSTLGSVSDSYIKMVEEYCEKDPDTVFHNNQLKQDKLEAELADLERQHNKTLALADAHAMSDGEQLLTLQKKLHQENVKLDELRNSINNCVTPEKFTYLMNINYLWCLVHPGENVGVLAGQSIGEPSTQMTLNTFHLAGHGGANVTLGIPRLREIIMTASEDIATPIMEIPVKAGLSDSSADLLAAKLNKIRLSECLKNITVKQKAGVVPGSREYNIRLQLKDMNSDWSKKNLVNMYNVAKCIAVQFTQKLNTMLKMKLRKGKDGLVGHSRMSRSKGEMATNSEDINVNEDDNDLLDSAARRALKQMEEGVQDSKLSKKNNEISTYDGEDDDEKDDEEEEEKDEQKTNEDGDDDEKEDGMTDDVSTHASTPANTTTKKQTEKDIKAAASLDTDLTMDFHEYARKLDALWRRHELISDVSFNKDAHFIDIKLIVPPGNVKVLMLSIIEKVADVCLVRYTKNINKAVVINRTTKGKTEKIVQTDGVNFFAIWQHEEADCGRLKSNDIHSILKIYGVEAARNVIMQEISGVFNVYGIAVDTRHLTLIADFMTFQGQYLAMNRNCMSARPSILQKATFETSMKFILDSCMRGDVEEITSPSSSIVLGKPIKSGTNAFSLLQPLNMNFTNKSK